MFRRGKRDAKENDPKPDMRAMALSVGPASIGLRPSPEQPSVYGVVMDTTYDFGVMTLVAFADGTTSLYATTGFGVIGGGAHPQVVAANQRLLRAAEQHRSLFAPDPSDAAPPEGAVTIRLLTFEGRLSATEQEETLGGGHSPLSPLFHAAHAVITELRQLA
jgi:hypothetical protein